MKVCEIFTSIEGEGKRSGALTTFVRFAGCNLRCHYCDTSYSWYCEDGQEMSVDEVYQKIQECSTAKVTLTGGEPLLQPFNEMSTLIELLCTNGYEVNVETNGSVNIGFFRTNPHIKDSLLFTVDYKCPSSGCSDKMDLDNYKRVQPWDVVKFVVSDTTDLEEAWRITRLMTSECYIYVSPVFGRIDPKEIVSFMKEHNITKWRLQLQLHKCIWDADQRGV